MMFKRTILYHRLRYVRARKRSHIYILFKSALVITIVCFILSYVRGSIMPFFIQAAEAEINQLVSDVIKNAVTDELGDDGKGFEFVIITRNSDNSIASIETDMSRLNSLSLRLSSCIQSELAQLNKNRIAIPMGVLFRNAMLSGIGPNIAVTAASTGKTNIEYKSEFAGAGINQTIYRLYLKVKVEIFFTIPMLTKSSDVTTDILLIETVIVGKVPNYYPSTKSGQ